MIAGLEHLLASWRQLRQSEEAVAAVEFALIVPIMLMLYIGSVEAGLLISTDKKLQSVAGSLGDLVARSEERISQDALEDYFRAAAGIMTPYSTDELKQVVTQVEVAADGSTNVLWSLQYQSGLLSIGTDYEEGETFELPQAMVNVARGSSVIVAEGRYAHPPIFGFAFNHTINLYRQNFFMPRFGEAIDFIPD